MIAFIVWLFPHWREVQVRHPHNIFVGYAWERGYGFLFSPPRVYKCAYPPGTEFEQAGGIVCPPPWAPAGADIVPKGLDFIPDQMAAPDHTWRAEIDWPRQVSEWGTLVFLTAFALIALHKRKNPPGLATRSEHPAESTPDAGASKGHTFQWSIPFRLKIGALRALCVGWIAFSVYRSQPAEITPPTVFAALLGELLDPITILLLVAIFLYAYRHSRRVIRKSQGF